MQVSRSFFGYRVVVFAPKDKPLARYVSVSKAPLASLIGAIGWLTCLAHMVQP